MTAYRYVIFPRGKQPSLDEVRQFESFAGLLANQFAWGVTRNDGRLTVACDRRAFDHARQVDPGFDSLLRKWEVRGGELADHLAFVKEPKALRPVATTVSHAPNDVGPTDAWRTDERIAAKTLAAKEAVGRSLLSVERTAERYALAQRVASAIPYLLIAAGVLATIMVGVYVRQRVLDGGPERRQATIERALDDPLREARERQEPG
jgi:hypothetical protein